MESIMSDILECFVAVAPYINQLTNTDFAVSVCNLEKCLIYVPGKKQNHQLKRGAPHVETSVSYQCIKTGQRIVKRVGSEVFGFPYIAIAIPLFDKEGKIIGSVAFTEAVDRQDLLLALADNLYDTMQQMMDITQSISKNSTELKEMGEKLQQVVGEASTGVVATEELLSRVKALSNQSSGLGSNVATEAMKLGDEGTSLQRLTREINHLAQATESYVQQANAMIAQLGERTEEIHQVLGGLLGIASHQIEINHYIHKLALDIHERAEKLRENARLLSEESKQ